MSDWTDWNDSLVWPIAGVILGVAVAVRWFMLAEGNKLGRRVLVASVPVAVLAITGLLIMLRVGPTVRTGPAPDDWHHVPGSNARWYCDGHTSTQVSPGGFGPDIVTVTQDDPRCGGVR